MTTFARACPVSLSRKPLSPGIEATPKTDLSLSCSLVHRQTWRLTGVYVWRDGIAQLHTIVTSKDSTAGQGRSCELSSYVDIAQSRVTDKSH